jgi:hypothetical protein
VVDLVSILFAKVIGFIDDEGEGRERNLIFTHQWAMSVQELQKVQIRQYCTVFHVFFGLRGRWRRWSLGIETSSLRFIKKFIADAKVAALVVRSKYKDCNVLYCKIDKAADRRASPLLQVPH